MREIPPRACHSLSHDEWVPIDAAALARSRTLPRDPVRATPCSAAVLMLCYGPNDHGKSTLTDAIRAALLVAPGTAEARSFQTWGGVAGQFPRVVLGFEIQGAVWRVEKVFAPGNTGQSATGEIDRWRRSIPYPC